MRAKTTTGKQVLPPALLRVLTHSLPIIKKADERIPSAFFASHQHATLTQHDTDGRHMTTSTFKHAAALIAVLVLTTPAARAQTAPNPPVSLTVISPIFSQLVRFSSPSDFVPVFENLNGNFYTRESVLKGETAQAWTQMITVTGTKSLAANPTLTPEAYAVSLAGGFKTVCPESFVALPLGAMRFGNQDGFAAIAGCGMVASSADKHSEIALIVTVKGIADFYTIQWAQRGPTSVAKPTIDRAAWQARLQQLSPIRLCAIVPGERAPYPSCVNSK